MHVAQRRLASDLWEPLVHGGPVVGDVACNGQTQHVKIPQQPQRAPAQAAAAVVQNPARMEQSAHHKTPARASNAMRALAPLSSRHLRWIGAFTIFVGTLI